MEIEFDKTYFELTLNVMGFKKKKNEDYYYKKIDYYNSNRLPYEGGFCKCEIIIYKKRKDGIFYIEAQIKGIFETYFPIYTGKFSFYQDLDLDKFEKHIHEIFKILAKISKPKINK